jgi:GntR family transcriptional regulator, transcriptional repressor for pyruvate dehydrogenase complex
MGIEPPAVVHAGRHFLAGRTGSLSAQIVADVRDDLFAKRLKPG